MSKSWLAEQLKLASDEVKDWPDWKKAELYARARKESEEVANQSKEVKKEAQQSN